MKAVKVTYSRLISKGNYENAKIEIELEVEEGEKASEVFEAAKSFCQHHDDELAKSFEARMKMPDNDFDGGGGA